jgi:wobble nucleotide-excising tRNase
MIESISIAGVATYDDTGVKIEGLKKVSFIYGANGTGKTTITKLLTDSNQSEFSKCSVLWKGGLPLPTLVYNRDFRERNFGKGKIDGVFTLGEATMEEKEAIEKMVSALGDIKSQGLQKKATLEQLKVEKQEAENSFSEAAWDDVFKKYKAIFKDAFEGVMASKTSFKEKLLVQASNNKSDLKSREDLETKALTIFGTAPVKLPLISQIEYSRLLEIETDPIWEKKIIGKSDIEISKLIQHLGINDWVNEGRAYIKDGAICPFCQEETITEGFRSQLGSYFDKTFEENTQSVKALSTEYALSSQSLVNLLDQIETKEKENPESKIEFELFSAKIKTVIVQLQANVKLVESKGKEPSRSITLTSLKEQLDGVAKLITNANTKLAEHNKIVDNYATEKTDLITSVWRFLIEEYSASITQHTSNIVGKQKGIEVVSEQRSDLLKKYTELDTKIKEANKNVTSVQPSVDEINKTLKAYGFLNFEIVPLKEDANQYQIQREDGSIAESTLSEGEITFITFLYFLQRAKGGLTQDSVSDERVLVIDDPISSLDSNVLFVVSTLIKEILGAVKNNKGVIRQVILLTHNVYFHKEVSYIDGKAQPNKDTLFWILRKKNKISKIQAYQMENPIHNSYQLLWRELKNHDHNDSITLQNTMRRIIENYFKILGGYHYDDLINSFMDSHEEQEICRSMVCWINDGSHTIPDDLFIQSHDDLKEKYAEVFKKIFINTQHYGHYKMMMGHKDEVEEALV